MTPMRARVVAQLLYNELWMHLGGLLRTQEARVALGYRLLHFFHA